MSVIVKDVNMPKSCIGCFLMHTETYHEQGGDFRACYDCIGKPIQGRLDIPSYCKLEEYTPKIEANIYDKETIIHNCTVQILENTVTGEISIGWKRNQEESE